MVWHYPGDGPYPRYPVPPDYGLCATGLHYLVEGQTRAESTDLRVKVLKPQELRRVVLPRRYAGDGCCERL